MIKQNYRLVSYRFHFDILPFVFTDKQRIQLYQKKNIYIYSNILKVTNNNLIKYVFNSIIMNASLLNKYNTNNSIYYVRITKTY